MKSLRRLRKVFSWTALTIEAEIDSDGRWLAAIPELPGVLAYGATREAAIEAAMAIARGLQVVAETPRDDLALSGVPMH